MPACFRHYSPPGVTEVVKEKKKAFAVIGKITENTIESDNEAATALWQEVRLKISEIENTAKKNKHGNIAGFRALKNDGYSQEMNENVHIAGAGTGKNKTPKGWCEGHPKQNSIFTGI